MASMATSLGFDVVEDEMPALLASFDIPSELHAVIGNFTPKLFGLVATDLTDLNHFLASLELASCSEDEFVVRAKIRRFWQHCSAPEVPAENPAVNATQPLSTTSSTSTWAETFPPKLDAAVVRSFRDRFEKDFFTERDGPVLERKIILELCVGVCVSESAKEWKCFGGCFSGLHGFDLFICMGMICQNACRRASLGSCVMQLGRVLQTHVHIVVGRHTCP